MAIKFFDFFSVLCSFLFPKKIILLLILNIVFHIKRFSQLSDDHWYETLKYLFGNSIHRWSLYFNVVPCRLTGHGVKENSNLSIGNLQSSTRGPEWNMSDLNYLGANMRKSAENLTTQKHRFPTSYISF